MTKNQNMITNNEIIDAENQYINLSDKDLKQLVEKAALEQPALFVFVATYYEGLKEDDSKELFLQLIYSIWIAYQNKYKLKRQLSIEEIESMDEEEERRLNNLYQDEEAMISEVLKRMTQHPQPELTAHIHTTIGDFFGFDDLDDEEIESDSLNDSGIVSGTVTLFVNLLESARENLHTVQ